MVDDPRLWIFDPKGLHEFQLQGFRGLVDKGLVAVDGRDTEILQLPEIVQRIENALNPITQIGGGTHAIEEKREVGLWRLDGELMRRRVVPDERDPSVVQLFEQRFEPVGMFMIN